ncbi:hypothetical protein [Actinocorallia herbida]|uniref:hypothetical protein n=1 Tax=Actinocorallia herbida TaxID=58109 RepID=UPI0011CD7C46|nr:hypothetical protein [Actinocorallia herbida]
MAAEFWLEVPKDLADHRSLNPRPAYENVAAVAKRIIASPHPRADELTRFCIKILALYATADQPMLASFAIEAFSARDLLTKAGMHAEERTLSAAMVLLSDYHGQSGHEIIMDIDDKGNIIEPADN